MYIPELSECLPLKSDEHISLRVDIQNAWKQHDSENALFKAKYIDIRIKFVGEVTMLIIIRPEYRETESVFRTCEKTHESISYSEIGRIASCDWFKVN